MNAFKTGSLFSERPQPQPQAQTENFCGVGKGAPSARITDGSSDRTARAVSESVKSVTRPAPVLKAARAGVSAAPG